MPCTHSVAAVRLIGVLLALAASACATSVRARSEQVGVNVLVYNIHAGRDRLGVDNLERVARMVLDSAVDIALIQEVDSITERSGRTDQLAELRRRTGFKGAFGRTLDYQGGGYGIAVLSRFPIVSDSLMRLPVTPRQERAGGSYEPRGVLHAAIVIERDTVHILNTHLDASGSDSYRRQEAAALVDITRRLTARGALVLLGGDLNSTPESAVHEIVETGGVRDVWNACGSGNGFSYPDTLPVKRIDYLLVSAQIRCVAARVLESAISDHRPVLFNIRF